MGKGMEDRVSQSQVKGGTGRYLRSKWQRGRSGCEDGEQTIIQITNAKKKKRSSSNG